jgi:chromosome segregation ATPase
LTDDNVAATASQKAIDQATQIHVITKERDLYENKLKALTLTMASTAEENREMEQENGELKKQIDALETEKLELLAQLAALRPAPVQGTWFNSISYSRA